MLSLSFFIFILKLFLIYVTISHHVISLLPPAGSDKALTPKLLSLLIFNVLAGFKLKELQHDKKKKLHYEGSLIHASLHTQHLRGRCQRGAICQASAQSSADLHVTTKNHEKKATWKLVLSASNNKIPLKIHKATKQKCKCFRFCSRRRERSMMSRRFGNAPVRMENILFVKAGSVL